MTTRKTSILLAGTAALAVLLSGCGGGDKEEAASGAPNAAEALALVSGTAQANNAEEGTGDWAYRDGGPELAAKREKALRWVELRGASAGDLDPVVVNGAGLTLYRFDKDEADPSKSNCFDKCAETWPPVTVRPGGKVFISNIEKSSIGFIKRGEGALQLTIGGWPIYRFNKDTKPGDTKGQGVQGTWFGVTPDGERAEGGEQGGAEQGGDEDSAEIIDKPQGGDEDGAEQGSEGPSAVFYEKTDFAGSTEKISETGCKNLDAAGVASSVKTESKVRMWVKKDCKGDVREIDADVADLADIDFDETVVSVRIVA